MQDVDQSVHGKSIDGIKVFVICQFRFNIYTYTDFMKIKKFKYSTINRSKMKLPILVQTTTSRVVHLVFSHLQIKKVYIIKIDTILGVTATLGATDNIRESWMYVIVFVH